MNTMIVLTVISEDHPGIIQTVSSVLEDHGGNWTQSSMSTLAGQFAGILLASVPSDKSEACIAGLQALRSQGMHVVAHSSSETTDTTGASQYILDLVGNDHPGIVHDITTLLVNHKVNVHDFESIVESASMGGGDVFRASALLYVPEGVDIDTLESELEEIANDLMVKISLEN